MKPTKEKTTVTAHFPGIGKVEISKERAERILWIQRVIRERKANDNQ